MLKLVLITKEDCPRCERAKKLLQKVKEELPIEWEEVDMYEYMDVLTYLGYKTVPLLLLYNEDEDYTEEDVIFVGELPRIWRLKEILKSKLEEVKRA
ncbi:glutaredoxin family protein [Aquifex aeolicus]|uniref:glutaredoxin family protein n=1 Tax=Aquifex aeolicus TaxID=63363 RepID=UPI0002D48BBD|nr:glutaredoxin family protein [Aquifex aeolicus]